MSTSTSSCTTQLLQDFLLQVYSRRLLLHTPLYQPLEAVAPATVNSHNPVEPYPGDNSFDANVVMVLSVLLCALICSLGLNSIIRCALRCSNLVASASGNTPSARLANTGIKKKARRTFPLVNYSTGMEFECVICLSEFTLGERIKVLPKCHHGFHPQCIDKWLNSHSSCPTCRHCLIETCQKIVGHSQVASSSTPPPPQIPQETIVRIAPLEPEGLIRNYQGIS
ncbi:RING-H2 finger protein ATL78-like [Actinidia eriantha]|uniref:RING-H2 finger protein ATL78-like n=1 Tax=Actinidia eriantha TaxID=165200 RepID=UPI00258E3459|nr:RING-H2 finger protein ATL78-like [Actinidia eriantha]